MNKSISFSNYVTSRRLLENFPFVLADVGASGGISKCWTVFGKYFQGIGFDPLVNECHRLNSKEHSGRTKYVAAFVGAEDDGMFPDVEERQNHLMDRLSVTLANELLETREHEMYNSYQDIVLAEEHVTLDNYFQGAGSFPDFIKIDTDGHDLEVLYGAEGMLRNGEVLGICIESQFHGSLHPRANTFANIDIFLREKGFTMFDMEFHKYSRRDLPGKFLISIPAQTDCGQVQWADVLYFRDLASKSYKRGREGGISMEALIKLACLYELHGLNDCAIELLRVWRDRLEPYLNVDTAVEFLVPPIENRPATLRDYLYRFEQSVETMRSIRNGSLKGISHNDKSDLQFCQNVVLFGAGGRLEDNLEQIQSYFSETTRYVVMDNDSRKWGGRIDVYPVISPSELNTLEPDVVVIVSTYAQDIMRQLIDYKIDQKMEFSIYTF